MDGTAVGWQYSMLRDLIEKDRGTGRPKLELRFCRIQF